jgi:hypothetical protein
MMRPLKFPAAIVCTLLIVFNGTLLAQDQDEVIALSDPLVITEHYKIYGAEMGEISGTTALKKAETIDFENREVHDLYFEGVLTEVCQTRGCNFFLDDEKSQVRVRFLDYGFFIPTDSNGKNAVVRGDFFQKEDEETGEPFVEILSTAIKIYN